jgi:hypothetical protein
VYAKVVHVTALAECARPYGARCKSKEVPGVVEEVLAEKISTNRNNTFMVATYTLGSDLVKKKKLNLRSVLAEPTNTQDVVPLENPGMDVASVMVDTGMSLNKVLQQ